MTDKVDTTDSLFALLEVCSEPVVLVEPQRMTVVARNPACSGVVDCAVGLDVTAALPSLARGAGAELFAAVSAGKIREADLEMEIPQGADNPELAFATMRRVQFEGQPVVGIVLRMGNRNASPTAERHDPLTALPDRAALLERLETLLAGERRDDHEFTILFIDLNEFKPINDQWGHVVGDRLIAEVARRLVACVRTGDTLVRYGGDEFVALLEGAAGEEVYRPVVERMHQALAEPFVLPDGNVISITASIGVADSCGPWQTPMELIHAADQAMYQAKRLQAEASRS